MESSVLLWAGWRRWEDRAVPVRPTSRCTAKRRKINRSRAHSGKSQSQKRLAFLCNFPTFLLYCFFFCVSRHHGHINNRHSRAYEFGTLAGENADWRKKAKRQSSRLENERRQRSGKWLGDFLGLGLSREVYSRIWIVSEQFLIKILFEINQKTFLVPNHCANPKENPEPRKILEKFNKAK